jgi:hypothetical protein
MLVSQFKCATAYEAELQQHDLAHSQALSIDLGTADNLAACVDTLGNSFAYWCSCHERDESIMEQESSN